MGKGEGNKGSAGKPAEATPKAKAPRFKYDNPAKVGGVATPANKRARAHSILAAFVSKHKRKPTTGELATLLAGVGIGHKRNGTGLLANTDTEMVRYAAVVREAYTCAADATVSAMPWARKVVG